MTWTRLSSRFSNCHADERVECSSDRIYGAFSVENVLKSVSNDFHGEDGKKKAAYIFY